MATKSRQKDALAVDRPEVFLRRERAAQKLGVVLLALFVLAGAAGLFGNGPLSHAMVTSGAVSVTFERFTRQTLRTALEVAADAPMTGAPIEIRVGREFLSAIDVLETRPFDALKRLDADAAIFEVPSSGGKAFLQLQYEPTRAGLLQTDVSVGAQSTAHVRQIVFF
jgi:hypothetical protein